MYFIELTDTYGGEANYCWVRRFKVKAKTQRGAVGKLARAYNAGWRKTWDDGETTRYNLKGAAVCCFVSCYNGESEIYSNVKEI